MMTIATDIPQTMLTCSCKNCSIWEIIYRKTKFLVRCANCKVEYAATDISIPLNGKLHWKAQG